MVQYPNWRDNDNAVVSCVHTIGHWASSISVFTTAAVPGLRALSGPAYTKTIVIAFSDDAKLRFAGMPAGTARHSIAYEGAKSLVNELQLVGKDDKLTTKAKSMFDKVVDPIVASEFSFGGKRSSAQKAPKKKFESTKICEILKLGLRKMYGEEAIPDTIFKKLMVDLLTQAPFRIKSK
ncbi:unnamed protein product [Bemisia tabaci]|uniref:Uncharacterized protein n=1 Tax=Bemisia tabaci TaxID=7038 RepID=A0A9P0EZN7_BEMTA|nr:unnamed protein product [Bemisia tabaci]